MAQSGYRQNVDRVSVELEISFSMECGQFPVALWSLGFLGRAEAVSDNQEKPLPLAQQLMDMRC